MSLKFGLNLKKKPQKKVNLEEEDSEPEQLPTKAPIKQKHVEHQIKALTEDASIFDYDAAYDKLKAQEEAKKRQRQGNENGERKARYMEDLIKNARERKLYQERLHERRIQKEKEELGIHNDKEEFVTSAYLEKQQELERLEREEEERDQKRGQGLQSFYRDLIESRTQVVEDVPIIPQEAPKKHQIVDHVARNDNQEIIDKRQLLQGGLNIVKEKPKIERSNRIHESTVHPVTNSQKIQEKPKTNPIQDSHMDSKRKQEPEDQEQKAQKIDKVQSARERYLARKAANT